MKLHRFFCTARLDGRGMTLEDRGLVHQLTRVLRFRPGDPLILCDGSGKEAHGRIRLIAPAIVEVDVERIEENQNEPPRSVQLYCAVLKRENFELVVQKATEVGVQGIIPVRSTRTVKLQTKPERLRKIMLEAAEQSGRGVLPSLTEPASLEEAMKHAKTNDLNFFFDLGATGSVLDARPQLMGAKKVGIFIGPEGGWDEAESGLARQEGLMITSLGARTLRGETAAIIAAYLVAA